MNKIVRFLVVEATLIAGLYVAKKYGKHISSCFELFKCSNSKNKVEESSVEDVKKDIETVNSSDVFKKQEVKKAPAKKTSSAKKSIKDKKEVKSEKTKEKIPVVNEKLVKNSKPTVRKVAKKIVAENTSNVEKTSK